MLHTGSAVALARDPEKQKLLKAKEDIEQKIDDLKYRKASLAVDDYRKQLAALLISLAEMQEALDKVKLYIPALVIALGFAAALPGFAQSGAQSGVQSAVVSKDVQACEALKHHGDANANACYQKLTRAADPAVQAEGFWALGDFKNANDAFRAANKARPKDANVRVRWGRMYLDHYQAPDAQDLFNEALMLNPGCSAAVVEKVAPAPGSTGHNTRAKATRSRRCRQRDSSEGIRRTAGLGAGGGREL